MQTSEDSITMTEGEAYRLRTALNCLLRGIEMNANGIEGRLSGNKMVIEFGAVSSFVIKTGDV
jgi:hypothetical protein